MKEVLLISIIVIQVIMARGVGGDLDRNFQHLQFISDGCLNKGGE